MQQTLFDAVRETFMIEKLREKARALPAKPGVYIMLDEAGDVIYVGKAKVLRNRVSSYFVGSHNAKTTALVSKICDFNVIVAKSEFEALVLENSLIKHHMPRYNILLKDDKGYPYVRLDRKKPYARFELVSKQENDGAVYFGPFGGRSVTKDAIEAVCKALKLPTCSRKFPRDIGKERPCLNFHMGNCRGYCLKDATQKEYDEQLEKAVMIFEGKTDKIIESLEKEMNEAAENLKFELAAAKRDSIRALESMKKKQTVLSLKNADTDAVGFYRGENKCCFAVLHYIKGQLLDKDYEILPTPLEEDADAISILIRRFYEVNGTAPENILLPMELPDGEAIEELLRSRYGRHTTLMVPQRGEKRSYSEAAQINAKEEIERITTKEERISKTAAYLKDALGLDTMPDRIEAYDISNTGADDIVASMTTFYKGKPLKKAYKRFKIKSVDGPDDYASMREVIERRLDRFLSDDEGFKPLPDLMLIDGGTVHAKTAQSVIISKNLSVPVFGMVKDDRHRTRALVSPDGREIGISAVPSVFAFIGTIQEETHRFAIEYNRSLRSKRVRKSALDGIAGVGDVRKAALLRHFKSIKAIKEAEIEELMLIVPENAARAIYESFRQEEGK